MPAERHDNDALLAHLDSVYRYAMRLTMSDTHWADDIVQETMLRAVSSGRSQGENDGLKAWLYTVLRNVWHDSLRRAKVRSQLSSLEPIELVQSQHISAERAAILTEEIEMRLADLDRLPERQRSVLYLSACESLTNHQIAGVLNITPQAVKASLCVARQRIRQLSRDAEPKTLEQTNLDATR